MLRGPFASALLVLALAAPAGGQSVRGSVNDVVTGHPIATVLITAVDAAGSLRAAATTDARGMFVLPIPRGDSIVVRVYQFGYRPLESIPLALKRSQSLQVEIGMHPEPVEIEGVTAVGRRSPNLERFLARRESGSGRYLGPEQIADLNPTSTTALLASMSGSVLRPSYSGGRILAHGRDTDSRAGLPSGTCVPTVYVDGFLLDDDHGSLSLDRHPTRTTPFLNERGVPIDSYVRASSVRAVEVYPMPGQAPAEFQRPLMPDCPVVVVWTSYGFSVR